MERLKSLKLFDWGRLFIWIDRVCWQLETGFLMVSSSISNKRYTYIHESESEANREAIDIHHVIINGSRVTGYARLRWLAFFLVALAIIMYFLLGKVMNDTFRRCFFVCLWCCYCFWVILSHCLEQVLLVHHSMINAYLRDQSRAILDLC